MNVLVCCYTLSRVVFFSSSWEEFESSGSEPGWTLDFNVCTKSVSWLNGNRQAWEAEFNCSKKLGPQLLWVYSIRCIVQISPLPWPIFLLSCSSTRWIFFLMFLWPRFKTWWQWKMATVFLFSSQDFRTTQGSGLGFKYIPGVLCWAVAWFCLACLCFIFIFFS